MKRIVSFLLSVIMVFSAFFCVDLSSFAADINVTNRVEWLTKLVEIFDMTVESDEYPDNYFSDLSEDSEYYKDILVAVEFGLVNVEAGNPIEPEGKITREFAAQTLNFCLGFELDKENSDFEYSFADYEDCLYPDDDQIAVNRGWFEIDGNGNFCPDMEVASSEITLMISDANSVLSKDKIKENYDSEYVFADYVVEVPNGTEVDLDENDTVLIRDCPITISVGDTFVVYINDLPSLFFADSVSVLDGITTITTSEADVENAIVSIDAQEITEVDATQIEPADGLEIEQLQAKPLNRTRSALVTDNSVTLSGQVDVGGVKIGLSAVISNIAVQTKLDTFGGEYSAVVVFDAALSTDLSVKLVNQDITLGRINIFGIGSVDLSLNISIDGKASIVQKYKSEVGFAFSISNGVRNISSFTKDEFSVVLQVSGSVGLRLSASINVLILKADVFGTIGLKIDVKSDSQMNTTPGRCDTIQAYMYANAGYNFTINLLLFKYAKSATWNFLTIENSPVRLYYHFEDGVLVNQCTAGETLNYVTPNTSPYAIVDTEYYQNQYTSSKFTYTVANNEVRITGLAKGYEPSELVIPSTIEDITVTSIGSQAFLNCHSLKSIVIQDGITSIEFNAFKDCNNLVEINLPNSLTIIGDQVFWGCNNLEKIIIPNNVESIGTNAFKNCSKLTSILIPASVTDIGKTPFYNCTGLENISVDKYNPKYSSENGVLFNKDITILLQYPAGNSRTNYSVPESVIDIESSAFSYCSNLNYVTINDGVSRIRSSLFAYCTNLLTVSIPNSVTRIDSCAFEHSSVSNIVIPDSVTTIGDSAFAYCSSLTNIKIGNNVKSIGEWSFSYCSSLLDLVIPDSVTDIEWYAFYACEKLSKVVLSKNMSTIEGNLFRSCKRLKEIVIPDGIVTIASWAFSECNSLTEIIVPNSVTTIEQGAFNNCISLTDIVLSKKINNIANSTFSGCTSLANITIPEFVTSIGDSAFKGCSSLTNIVIPDSVINIYNYAFSECVELINVVIGNGVSRIYSGAFEKCISLKNIDFGNNIVSIDRWSFSHCESLSTITLPISLEIIDSNAFENCASLEEMIIYNNLSTVGKNTFRGCENLQVVYYYGSVSEWCKIEFNDDSFSRPNYLADDFYLLGDLSFPTDLKHIPDYAFMNCENWTELIIPDGLTSIGNYAFYGSNNLTSVTIGKNVEKIGGWSFTSCNNLKNIILGENVKSIGQCAFEQCEKLSEIEIPSSLNSIPAYAFTSCYNLTEIVIPNSVKSVGFCAFANCSNLTNVYYTGTKTQWDNIDISPFNNSRLENATIHCNSTGLYKHGYTAVATPPTCTEEGYTTYTCTCGESYVDDYVSATGHTLGTWSYNGDAEYTSSSNYQNGTQTRICTVCGETETIEAPNTALLRRRGNALALESSITLTTYITKDVVDYYDEVYAEFARNGKTEKVYASDDTFASGSTVYNVFEYKGIPPQAMGDDIEITFYGIKDGVTYWGETYTYSVTDYVKSTLSKTTTSDKLKTMLVDLMYYGAACQTYQNYKTDQLMTDILTEEQKQYKSAYDLELKNIKDASYETCENRLVRFGTALRLNNAVEMAIALNLTDVALDDLTFKVKIGTRELTYTYAENPKNFEKGKDGYWYFYFDGVYANQMSEEVFITAYRGNEQVSYTLRYSIESYASTVTDAKLKAVTDAMMYYGNSAKAYAG